MTRNAADLPLAQAGAKAIAQAFDDYHSGFKAITRRAKSRFEERDWRGVQRDAVERLDLRERVVNQAVADVRAWLGAETLNKSLWAGVKNCYSTLIAGRDDFELAETFFTSVTRRIFTTVGVDPSIEYAAPDFKTRPLNAARPIYKVYPRKTTTRDLIKEILADYAFRAPHQGLEEDAARAAAAARPGPAESRAGGGRGCRADDRVGSQHRLQLPPLLFPRRSRAAQRADQVPENPHAAQAGGRTVHLHRAPQARQDGAVPRTDGPPQQFRQPIRAGAGRPGDGHGGLHAPLL